MAPVIAADRRIDSRDVTRSMLNAESPALRRERGGFVKGIRRHRLLGHVESSAMDRYAHDKANRFPWLKYALLGVLAAVTLIVVIMAVTR